MSKRKFQKPYKVLLSLLALGIICLLPAAGLNDYYLTICCQAIIYSMIVLGLNFITGMTGQMNLGTAGVFALGAYASGVLSVKTGLSPWLGLILAVIVGLAVGLMLGYPSLRVQGVYLSLTTIGFCEIVRQLLRNWDYAGGTNGLRSIPAFQLFGWKIKSASANLYFLLGFLMLFLLISHRIIQSKYGRAFIAVRDNVDAVEACGINLARIKITAFVISTVFGAFAGALYAGFNGYIAPNTFSVDLSVSFVVMLTLGGRGSIAGCLSGAFIIAFAPELLRFLGINYKLVYAFMILLVIIFNPDGLVSITKRIRDVKKKRNAHAETQRK